MSRPDHLPDFKKPPLNEVVLGVQFRPPRGYLQIYAGEVWGLFRKEFPSVQELPAIPPMFETFGLPHEPSQFSIGFTTAPTPNRFWFLSNDKDELIQFQHDRLLHNWRKVRDANTYPRFETIIAKFKAELLLLEEYFNTIYPQSLIISQCEVSYINHIAADKTAMTPRAHEWIRFLQFGESVPDDFSATFRQTIYGSDRSPLGRLICDAETVLTPDGQQVIRLTLTARGAPSATDIPAALDFLKIGRERVVVLFKNVTTESAHDRWERIQ